MKTIKEIKDFKGIALKGKMCSCGKPATLTYAESYMSFTHGNSKPMCDDCYNEILRKTPAYELGKQEVYKEFKQRVLDLQHTAKNDLDLSEVEWIGVDWIVTRLLMQISKKQKEVGK